MIQIQNFTVRSLHDDRILIEDLSVSFQTGDKAVIIGEEGNGKSTFIKWLYDPSLIESYAVYRGKRIIHSEVLGYLRQELGSIDQKKTVFAYLSEEYLFTEDYTNHSRIARELGLSEDFFYSDQVISTLSGGEKVKLQTARILFSKATALLLDEPSNDLDLETLQWMEKLIQNFDGIVIFVSHDEVLIEHCANRIIHLEALKRKNISQVTISGCSYSDYVKERRNQFEKETLLAESERREDQIRMEKYRRIESRVEHELRTITRQNAHGGRLLKKKMKAVKSMEKRFAKEREEMRSFPEQEEAILFRFDENIRIPNGKVVCSFKTDVLENNDGRILAGNIHLQVAGPEHICIIGKNGIGKSTLLKIIYEELKNRTDIRVGYMPQNYEDILDPDSTPVMILAPSGEKESVTKARSFLGAMRYTTKEMEHSMRELSGGQRAKILLSKMNLDQADVLILDEPTRNFSPLSNPVIRETFKSFHGAFISVSHDRKWIEEVCDTVYELTADGLLKIR